MPDRIAIYGSRRQQPHLDRLDSLLALLEERGFKVTLHNKLGRYLRDNGVMLHGAAMSADFPEDAALVISLGGDGTFMRAARWSGRREVPVLGVNTGHLGFLSSCRLEQLPGMIDAICRGEVAVERRMMLTVECDGLPDTVWPFAVNEVAVFRDESASMISVRTEINGCFLADFRADGLIVATPTGSTAYNLSAGGPIIEPTLDCMVISPVAPHTLTVRPLVVGGGSELELCVESRSRSFRLSLDGRSVSLPAGSKLKVRRADFATMLVRSKDTTFAGVLRDKLLWTASTYD